MVTPDDPDARMLTAKGSARSEAVLEAAIACLGEDGYAGTSLQRVAARAGVQKRMVLYYFGSRERLVERALQRLADRFLDELEACIDRHAAPNALVDALVDTTLANLSNRPLLAAYLGLVAESANDPSLQDTLTAIRGRAAALADRAADRLEAGGRTLSMQRELLFLAATVAANGLAVELLERGPSDDLDRAVALGRAALPLLLFE
jgi:AcrR family transcriptional regulator